MSVNNKTPNNKMSARDPEVLKQRWEEFAEANQYACNLNSLLYRLKDGANISIDGDVQLDNTKVIEALQGNNTSRDVVTAIDEMKTGILEELANIGRGPGIVKVITLKKSFFDPLLAAGTLDEDFLYVVVDDSVEPNVVTLWKGTIQIIGGGSSDVSSLTTRIAKLEALLSVEQEGGGTKLAENMGEVFNQTINENIEETQTTIQNIVGETFIVVDESALDEIEA